MAADGLMGDLDEDLEMDMMHFVMNMKKAEGITFFLVTYNRPRKTDEAAIQDVERSHPDSIKKGRKIFPPVFDCRLIVLISDPHPRRALFSAPRVQIFRHLCSTP